MIELIDFSKSYSSKNDFAVKNINMICKDGEITGLLGLNGAGKTTILKAICGRHIATGGKVLIDGIDASENLEKARNITGFVEEEPALPGEYTVCEYLKMTAGLHGFDFEGTGLKEPDISDIIGKKIKTLSKGQRQRVNFAKSLVYNPKVLVFDEPASGLDPAQIIKMRSLVKALKVGRTILLSTHLMQEAEALCDKVYILHGGKIVSFGSIGQILSETKTQTLEDAFFYLTKTLGEEK